MCHFGLILFVAICSVVIYNSSAQEIVCDDNYVFWEANSCPKGKGWGCWAEPGRRERECRERNWAGKNYRRYTYNLQPGRPCYCCGVCPYPNDEVIRSHVPGAFRVLMSVTDFFGGSLDYCSG